MARGKVCNFAFLTSSGGKFNEFFLTFALVIHPLTVKVGPVRLFGHVRLIGRIRYLLLLILLLFLLLLSSLLLLLFRWQCVTSTMRR